MAVIFIQIFDLNVKFELFQVPLLAPADVTAALLRLIGTPEGVSPCVPAPRTPRSSRSS